MTDLVRGLLDDVRDLFREEAALARAEAREELGRAMAAGARLAVGGAALAMGVLLLLFAIGRGLAGWFGWPVGWGYALIGVIVTVVGALALGAGQKRLREVRSMPKTTQALKDNV